MLASWTVKQGFVSCIVLVMCAAYPCTPHGAPSVSPCASTYRPTGRWSSATRKPSEPSLLSWHPQPPKFPQTSCPACCGLHPHLPLTHQQPSSNSNASKHSLSPPAAAQAAQAAASVRPAVAGPWTCLRMTASLGLSTAAGLRAYPRLCSSFWGPHRCWQVRDVLRVGPRRWQVHRLSCLEQPLESRCLTRPHSVQCGFEPVSTTTHASCFVAVYTPTHLHSNTPAPGDLDALDSQELPVVAAALADLEYRDPFLLTVVAGGFDLCVLWVSFVCALGAPPGWLLSERRASAHGYSQPCRWYL